MTDYDGLNGVPPNAAPGGPLNRTLPNGATGVDLNRNFDTPAWGYDANPNSMNAQWRPDRDAYFGPRRNSETETQAIQAALAAQPPRIMIDYHSYGGFILYPSEAYYSGLVNAGYTAAGLTLRALTRDQNANSYQLGHPGAVLNYDGTGSVIDHAATRQATRAITIELDAGPPDPTGVNQYAGFYLPENMIRTVFERNIRGALAMLAVPDINHYQMTVNNFMTWNVWGRGNRLPSL